MMDYGLIFTIIGAAWLAKSLMQAFERMEKSTKKTAQLRQTTARSVTQGNHESIIIILRLMLFCKYFKNNFEVWRKGLQTGENACHPLL